MDDKRLMMAALAWYDAGACVLPAAVDGTKAPGLSSWKQYTQTRAPRDLLATWLHERDGFGLVMGEVSGNLEMLEFEGRAAQAGMPGQLGALMLEAGAYDIWNTLTAGYIEFTPTGGLHFIYRVDGAVRPNTKLARNANHQVLIETRGEGGYVVVAPSAGRTHPNGGEWRAHHGGPAQLATLTEDERDLLFAVATTLDESPPTGTLGDRGQGPNVPSGTLGDAERPGDDYNARADWRDILERHGWTPVRPMGQGWTWRRPGKDRGISATTGQAGDGVDRLFVFSTSTEFDSERPYTKFAAYALLEHRGDYAAAAGALRKAGYGAPRQPSTETIRATLSLEQLGGGAEGPANDTGPPGGSEGSAGSGSAEDAEEKEFWQSRPVLGHIQTYARARRVSPWALLGCVLARVVCAVRPFVVLPPLVGEDASLNLFVGLVGPSGAGKGAAESAAARAVHVGDLEIAGVGSGEGILHMFARRVKDGIDQHTESVLFSVPEIDTLTALGDRKGSTLLSELRKAWSGEQLSFAYVDPTKKLRLAAHKYRLSMVAGIQPGRAQALLSDVAGGTPQRFIWLPATDPDAPDVPPAVPAPLTWRMPRVGNADPWTGRAVLAVCETAKTIIDSERLKRLRDEPDPLDGHLLLARLKVAAALALLDQRAEVTDEDWQLAGIVIGVSDRTRTSIQAHLADADRRHNEAIGRSEGIRQEVAGEHLAEVAVRRTCNAVMRKVKREAEGAEGEGWVAGAVIKKGISSRDRKYAEDAIERLVDAGQLEVAPADSGHGSAGVLYRST